jgi:uncharacterized protein (DUF1330 family)
MAGASVGGLFHVERAIAPWNIDAEFTRAAHIRNLESRALKQGSDAMKHYLSVGLGMVAGAVLGAAAVSALHAQAKPTVYLVTEIDVSNPQAYGKEFAPKAQATIKAAGGRLVAIGGAGGAGAKQLVVLAGAPPKRMVIQAWDSMDQLKSWYNSEAYQAALKIGAKYATFRRVAIEGVAK